MRGSSRAGAWLLALALAVLGGCSTRQWQPVAWSDEMAPADTTIAALEVGSTIRVVTTADARHEGVLCELSAYAIVLTESADLGQDISIARADIASLEVAERQPLRSETIVAGVTLGALAIVAAVVAAVAIWGTPGIGN